MHALANDPVKGGEQGPAKSISEYHAVSGVVGGRHPWVGPDKGHGEEELLLDARMLGGLLHNGQRLPGLLHGLRVDELGLSDLGVGLEARLAGGEGAQVEAGGVTANREEAEIDAARQDKMA